SSSWASNGFGAMQVPRIGDEVIVDFINGDPDRPIITGRVYNAANMPPWNLPEHATQMGIYSRSTPDGDYGTANAIRFEDKKGQEQLWIHAERNQDIEVEYDESLVVGHDRKKEVRNDDSEEIGRDKMVSIGRNLTERIGKNQETTVENAQSSNVGKFKSDTVGDHYQISVGKIFEINVGEKFIINVGKTRLQMDSFGF